MDQIDAVAVRLEVKATEDFEKCKKVYRSMTPSGVTVVTDTRRVPEGLQEKLDPTVKEEEGEERQELQEEEDDGDDEEGVEDGEELQDEHQELQEDDDDDEKEEKEDEEKEEILPRMKLVQGSHKMGPTNLSCLICKLEKPNQKAYDTFCLLRNIRHPAIVTREAFYEESGQPGIVLSWVDCKLQDFARSNEGSVMFFASNNSGCDLTPWFRTVILGLCSGMEHLLNLGLYPLRIKLDDLYVCKDGPRKRRIKMLILEAEEFRGDPVGAEDRRTKLWKQLRFTIRKIKSITSGDTAMFGKVAKRFINYIGGDVSMLAQYPVSWSYEQKKQYLFAVIAVDMNVILLKLQTSGLKWPVDKKTGKLPKLLLELIENDNKKDNPHNYSTQEPYDYLRLTRAAIKHLDTLCKELALLRDVCRSYEDFLAKMEKWQPLIWCILYEAIGPL